MFQKSHQPRACARASKSSHHHSHTPSERGTSITEFAVILPAIALLLFGFIQWAMIFASNISLRNTASLAARYAVLGDPAPSDSEISDAAKNSALPPLDSTDISVSVTRNHYLNASQNGIKVDLTYNMGLILPWVVPGSSGGVLQLNASAVMY